jgi:uncharacterized damage-inducible protein DinB
MATFKSTDLLTGLQEDVQRLIVSAEHIKGIEKSKLVYQTDKSQWSIVQILEHLNAYGRYYLPAIENAMAADHTAKDAWFQPGRLGQYFTKSMKPTNVYEITNKMNAMKNYSFPNSLNVDTVVNEYLEQKQKLLQLLETAKQKNLNAIRIPITINKLIKLKLGDIFRFLIAHEQRHMIQARNTLKAVGMSTDKFPVILEISNAPQV